MEGTASNGVDYETLPTTVAIAPLATQAMLVLTPKPDAVAEGSETVVVTIVASDDPCVTVGFPDSATIAIVDGDALPVDAFATTVVVPVVAQTLSYGTEVYVRNPNVGMLTLNVHFYEATNSAVPGPRSCTQFVVPAATTSLLTLAQQCTLGAGSHFGMLVLEDAANPKVSAFTAYSRSQTPAGVGFSVEGFPLSTFGAAVATADGLKRSSTGPHHQSNCFIAALAGNIDYRIDLSTADGAPIGTGVTGSLSPYEIVRHSDVFAVAGASSGDYSSVRAQFTQMAPGGAPYVGFCTLQESVTFSADFRIAKREAAVATPMVVPIVARTASYDSEVYVRNANADPITLDIRFYESDNAAVPLQEQCGPLDVPAKSSRMLSIGAGCALPSGSHFGMLVLQEWVAPGTHPFAVFSRSQTPAGVGFSVEGVPLTHVGTAPASVDGLKRSSTGPKYQSNCFVAAPATPLDYRIDLTTGSGAAIGAPIVGSLDEHHSIRYLDVLAQAGAPAGDYSNVRAIITETSPGTSSMIGYCTMQESVTFGADFRIAK